MPYALSPLLYQVEKFIDGLLKLKETSPLNPPNILNILKPSTMTPAVSVPWGEILAVRLQVGLEDMESVLPAISIQNNIFNSKTSAWILPIITSDFDYQEVSDASNWFTGQAAVILNYALAILAAQNMKASDLQAGKLDPEVFALLNQLGQGAENLYGFKEGKIITSMKQVQSFIANYRAEVRVRQAA
ncbi:MAG: hypothetical protein EXS63_04890 [Candidatus Omnitrophica bacterium]|nr:hypothetical protein [Candidatus Omnitrophota bacterium]